MLWIIFLVFISLSSALPTTFLRRIAEGTNFDDIDNYLPKFGDIPPNDYSQDQKTFDELLLKNNLATTEKPLEDTSNKERPSFSNIFSLLKQDSTTTDYPLFSGDFVETTTNKTTLQNRDNSTSDLSLDPFFEANFTGGNDTRLTRQKQTELNNNSTKLEGPEKESQEEEDEEDGNMVTSILSGLLGSLSRPDGSIDLEALTGLLGSLSTQNPDGSYDFSGLTELLMGFFGGGGDEEGGGSDLGAFVGGLAGAVIRGVANPPGAKGVGIFAGKVVTGVLPALSAPPPADENNPDAVSKPIDSGGFLVGFLSTVLSGLGSMVSALLGASSGSSGSSSGSGGNGGQKGGSKYTLIKGLLSSFTSLSSSSSKH